MKIRRVLPHPTPALLILLLLARPACAQVPHRIVSLSPNITEMLYGIGAFEQVVGVSDYCSYPPAVKNLPSVGGWHNPSLEKLAALHPDLVIVDEGQAPFMEDNFKNLGLRVMTATDLRIEDVYRAMAALGRATGHQAEAARLIDTTREGLRRVAARTANRPKLKVALIVDRTPGTLRDLYTATDGGYLAELVQIAGGRIAVAADKRGYAKLSKEDLLAANPDWILDFVQSPQGRLAADAIGPWREMSELQAVRAGHVRSVNEDFVPHASQRMLQTAELFARILHPEVP